MRLLPAAFIAITAVAAHAMPVRAQPAPTLEVEALTRTYLCEEAAVVRVAYLNFAQGESLAVVDFGGRLIPMQAGPTGSGVRYVALDPMSGLVWHTKGDEGLLADDAGGDQQTILRDCHTAER